MESTNTTVRAASSVSRARRTSTLALAAALLFTSLFVDVGVARAEYAAGWDSDVLMDVGGCIGYCGTFFISKTALAKYGFGASCLGCVIKLFGELNDWAVATDPGNCFTGVLGQPCGGQEYTSR
ncbi:MAG TPA: hypothetical protein VJ982_05440 [Gemmatimonadota bacterium]|nr:hypothetical protein [Gemmatimonadota bacterium]